MLQPIKLLCLARGHHRSRGEARWDEQGVLRSYCKRCRTPLVRQWDGSWTVVEQPREAGCNS